MGQSFDKVLDVRGLACPMPLLKARKEIANIEPGQMLKVMATDRGSVADFQGWVSISKNVELVEQDTESMDGTKVYVHYVKRTS